MVDDEFRIKLIDFGISNYCREGETRATFCGTDEYLAPEVIAQEQQTSKLDIWTIGVLAY
jgi:serine/threonine protein kinase